MNPQDEKKRFDPDLPRVLIDLFGEALDHWCPRSAAYLEARPAAMGVNFWYLDEPGNRYIRKCSLDLHCGDLTAQQVDLERVKLVHAPLIIEHLIDADLLDDALALVAPGGALSVIVEVAEEFGGKVSRGQAPSVNRQKGREFVEDALAKKGFLLTHELRRTLNSRRKLWLGIFAK